VAIIGAGVAGLGAAFKLRRAADAGCSVAYRVFEATGRVGGQLWTERTADGIVADGGSDSYLTRKPSIRRVAGLLGMADAICGTDDTNKQTYIVKDGQLVALPDGIMMFAPTKVLPMATTRLYSWPAKFRMLGDLVLPRRKQPAGGMTDESIASLVRRRLGNECLVRLAEPLVGGVNGSDVETMSTLATYPDLLAMEQQYGSLIRGFLAQRKRGQAAARNAESNRRAHEKTSHEVFSESARNADVNKEAAHEKTFKKVFSESAPFVPNERAARPTFFSSFRDGLGSFTDALADAVGREHIHLNTPIEHLDFVEGTYCLAGEHFDAVIIAAPAWCAAELLRTFASDTADILSVIPHSSCATVVSAYADADGPRDRAWHGVLAPHIEHERVTGISYVSSKWQGRTPPGLCLLRGFVGGARDPETPLLPDDELVELVHDSYVRLLGVPAQARPVWSRVFRFPRSMPQYLVGHLDRMEELSQLLAARPGLALAGAAYRGVGVPNCLESGEEAACKVLLDAGMVFNENATGVGA
jgi:oxygen-dependent protoporphyrinogen oxidase